MTSFTHHLWSHQPLQSRLTARCNPPFPPPRQLMICVGRYRSTSIDKDFIQMESHNMSFCLFFSLGTIILRLIYFAAYINSSVLFTAEWCPIGWLYDNLSTHQLIDVGFSQFWTITNKATMNTRMFLCVDVRKHVYLGYIPRSEMARWYGRCMFTF